MPLSKRRTSAEAHSTTTTHRTSRSVTSVSRKLLDEKENILRKANYDNRKTLDERQNLSDALLEEDYFERLPKTDYTYGDSGSYRADCIGKPWRSPNLSRRGIHSSYEGSVKSYSGTGEVISTASWQSTSYNSSEQSSRQLDVGACDGVDVVTRLQSNSETSNNSNSNMRTRSMRISEFTEDMDPVDSVAVNSNNSASQKRGARQITMWKTGGVVESKATQSASRRIASIFGLDKEEDESECRGRTTNSRTRKVAANSEKKSNSTYTTDYSSVSTFTRISSWICSLFFRRTTDDGIYDSECSQSSTHKRSTRHGIFKSTVMILTSVLITLIHTALYTPKIVRDWTGARVWPLVPFYSAFAVLRRLSSSTLSVLHSCVMLVSRLFTRTDENQLKSTSRASESVRSKRFGWCCPFPWGCCILILLPLLFFSSSGVMDNSTVPVIANQSNQNSTAIQWTSECFLSIIRLFTTLLCSIRDCVLRLISTDKVSLPTDPPLSGKEGVIDKSLYDSLVISIRDHSARLVAQEKELKAQKAMLEGLVVSHKTSESTTKLNVQINKWEGDLKSVQSRLSTLDAALAELKTLKLGSKEAKAAAGVSGQNSKDLVRLSERVEALAAEQQKQKGFGDELQKLHELIVKLEGHVKEQKAWTITELENHAADFKKLMTSFSATSSKDVRADDKSAKVSESSAALKALSDKVMADHERLGIFETQHKSLQALLADLQKKMGTHAEASRAKDSSTDQSLTSIEAKLQSLENDQKVLKQRLDERAGLGDGQQQSGATLASVNVAGGCGKDCPSAAGVQELIDRTLAVFAADRIAKPDFALESAGGSIIGTRCTQTYTDRPAVFSLFGIPLFRMSRSPRTVIQPSLHPGECWAFSGTKGQLVVRLASDIKVSGITLEHVPKSLSPNGRIDSAPRRFAIKGLASESDYKGVMLGEFEYLDNGQPLQTFELAPPHQVFRYIELQILSNHGHAEYTCVYRLRVHGKIVNDAESDSEVR